MSSTLQNELQGNVQPMGRADGLADSLIRVNGLQYRMPSNMSVVTMRSMNRSFANLDKYNAGGKIIVTWNTGASYVNSANSYLTFDVKMLTGEGKVAEASFESGSACNLIDNVTVTSIQGTEVDRTEGVNSYTRDMDRWTYSQN